jgi:1,2-diacylglycerol 3-beta-glucosyltransferase
MFRRGCDGSSGSEDIDSVNSPLGWLVALVMVAAALPATATVLWLASLLIAAVLPRRSRTQGDGHPALVVVIPAHDEEMVIAQTLRSLAGQDYPSDRFRTVVVADNCTDRTAQIARDAGAVVLEREDRVARGKGFALAWAFERILSRSEPVAGFVPDACVIVDADTWVDPKCLAILASHVPSDPAVPVAVQGRYGVLNPDSGWRAALMTAAFELCNHVRLLGTDRFGGSVGLKGNGMIFSRGVLERLPWSGSSVTEDIDYGLDLLLRQGVRVQYAPEALVQAQMPVTASQGESQRARWEGGRYRLMARRVPELLAAAPRRRDIRLVWSAFDLATLPLAEVVASLLIWGLLCVPAWWMLPQSFALAAATACGAVGAILAVYVLFGLRVAGAGADTYRALLRVPTYVFWKLAIYLRGRLSAGRKSGAPPGADAEWVRTERVAMDDDLGNHPAGGAR